MFDGTNDDEPLDIGCFPNMFRRFLGQRSLLQEPSKSSNANVSEQPKAPEKKEPEPQGARNVILGDDLTRLCL